MVSYLETMCIFIMASHHFGIQSDWAEKAQEALINKKVQLPAYMVELEREYVRIHNTVASRGQKYIDEGNVILDQYFIHKERIVQLLKDGFVQNLDCACSFVKKVNPHPNFSGEFEYSTYLFFVNDSQFTINGRKLDGDGNSIELFYGENLPITSFATVLPMIIGLVEKDIKERKQ